jgi:hypothetical protein
MQVDTPKSYLVVYTIVVSSVDLCRYAALVKQGVYKSSLPSKPVPSPEPSRRKCRGSKCLDEQHPYDGALLSTLKRCAKSRATYMQKNTMLNKYAKK